MDIPRVSLERVPYFSMVLTTEQVFIMVTLVLDGIVVAVCNTSLY